MKPTDYPYKDEETWMREVLTDFRIPFDDHQAGRRLALTCWMKTLEDDMRDRMGTTCTCTDFKAAEKTDAVESYSWQGKDREWLLSEYRVPLQFCPWCGKKLP